MTATAAPGADLVQLARAAVPADDDSGWRGRETGAAAEWIEAHGFPTANDEDWRYLPLGSILSAAFRPAGPALARAATTGMVDALAPELGGLRLVFVNGWFAPDASSLAALPDGATVRAASSAPIDTRNRSCSARPSAPYRHAFEALNVLLTTDGADIRVAAGVTIDEPIHLVYLSDPSGPPVVSSPRSTIVAAPGSRAAIAETFAGGAGAAA